MKLPKIAYDKTVDAFYLKVGKGKISRTATIPLDEDIILDFNKDAKVVGIEILNFKARFK